MCRANEHSLRLTSPNRSQRFSKCVSFCVTLPSFIWSHFYFFLTSSFFSKYPKYKWKNITIIKLFVMYLLHVFPQIPFWIKIPVRLFFFYYYDYFPSIIWALYNNIKLAFYHHCVCLELLFFWITKWPFLKAKGVFHRTIMAPYLQQWFYRNLSVNQYTSEKFMYFCNSLH